MIEFAVAQQMKLQDMLAELVARLEREEGQDLIEYSLLAALIAVATVAIMFTLGHQINNLFTFVSNTLGSA